MKIRTGSIILWKNALFCERGFGIITSVSRNGMETPIDVKNKLDDYNVCIYWSNPHAFAKHMSALHIAKHCVLLDF